MDLFINNKKEGYFMKNLKTSILKKALLVLLASFLFAASSKLLQGAIFKINPEGSGESLKIQLNEGIYHKISSDHKTFCLLNIDLLRIYRWDGSEFIEHSVIYENVVDYKISSDGQTICVGFKGKILRIYRWDGSEFIEHPETYNDVCLVDISKDGKTIVVFFKGEEKRLDILRLDEQEGNFVCLKRYRNVEFFRFTPDKKRLVYKFSDSEHLYVFDFDRLCGSSPVPMGSR